MKNFLNLVQKETFGMRLRRLRRSKGMTQLDLARRLGITATGVAAYEQSNREPGIKKICQLKRALGIRFIDLLAQLYFPDEGQQASGLARGLRH